MKKIITLAAGLCAATALASAGGYVTNTNQNIAFLRNPSQNAAIGVYGAYFNPAGIGFMNDGWHLAFDVQTAVQQRHTTATYEPLKYGVNNGGRGYKTYKGKSFVPVLPHFDMAYKHDRMFASFHFGVVSGGGKAKYAEGLGSFEAPVAMIPALINNITGTQTVTAYDADIHLTGEQYNFSGQLNLGYRLTEKLSVSAGLRLNYLVNSYAGSLKNIRLEYGGNMLPAATVLGSAISTVSGGMLPTETAIGIASGLVGDKALDARQTDLAWTPVLSVDYKTGKFNFSARYEFNTRVRLKNDTKENTTGIAQYDLDRVAADIPGSLNLGGQYEVKPNFRVSLGANIYLDKGARQYNSETGKNDKQDCLKHNSYEILGGMEYDVNKKLTLSIGANKTVFGFGSDAKYISDMSYTTNSISGGLGAVYHINSKMSIEAGIYKTFFEHLTKEQADYGGNGALIASKLAPVLGQLAGTVPGLAEKLSADNLRIPGQDDFYRTSFVSGIGITYNF